MAQIKHISFWEEAIDKVQFPKLTHLQWSICKRIRHTNS
jgi:hypothetical protein